MGNEFTPAERYADPADEATVRAEAEVQSRIAASRSVLQQKGTTHCEFCGDPIPEERRKAFPGARAHVRCIEEEERRKGYHVGRR